MSNEHTVRIPEIFFDQWLPKLSSGEWALLSAVLRKTYGEGETEATLTVTQLMEMTGLSESTVQRNMASLLKSGVPVEVICRGQNGTTYLITEHLAGLAIEEGIYNLIALANSGAPYEELRSVFLATATAAERRAR